ncbi:MAG: hypothetical protein MRK01_17535 [Candidatus Scalindua sp.]|nr:hypothetical protein [Candidatus Scalindua sp.]
MRELDKLIKPNIALDMLVYKPEDVVVFTQREFQWGFVISWSRSFRKIISLKTGHFYSGVTVWGKILDFSASFCKV